MNFYLLLIYFFTRLFRGLYDIGLTGCKIKYTLNHKSMELDLN